MRPLQIHRIIMDRCALEVSGPLVAPRVGEIRRHDSSVSVWEDAVDEQRMREEVMVPMLRLLKRRGWKVTADPMTLKHYRSISRDTRHCRRGDLELMVRLGGRHLEMTFFQNVANVRNPNGGRYDFDKLAQMPYRLRLATILEVARLTAFLVARHGYRIQPLEMTYADLGPGGATATAWIENEYARSCHTDKALGRPAFCNLDNRRSADGDLLDQGMTVWVRSADREGKRGWLRGAAYYCLNNMWRVVTGPYSVRTYGSFEIHVRPPLNLRDRRADARTRRAALERQLQNAVDRLDFSRAARLRQVLFGETPVYRIWSSKNDAWYAPLCEGYSRDANRAGLYTIEEALRAVRGIPYLTIIPASGQPVPVEAAHG